MSANSQNALSKAPLPPRYRRNKTEALLSEEEKRLNHIASEQKRRQNIKLAYDQLTELVPSLSASSLDPASSGSISGSGLVTTSGKGEVQILSKSMYFSNHYDHSFIHMLNCSNGFYSRRTAVA